MEVGRDVLNLTIDTKSDIDPEEIQFTVNITEWTERDLTLYMNYS